MKEGLSLPIGIMQSRERIKGMMPTNMSNRRSSSLLVKGPMEPKQKSDRTPPDASVMPRYKMASLFDQPKLSLAMGVTSLKLDHLG